MLELFIILFVFSAVFNIIGCLKVKEKNELIERLQKGHVPHEIVCEYCLQTICEASETNTPTYIRLRTQIHDMFDCLNSPKRGF